MTFHRETARFTLVGISCLALAAAVAGCTGSSDGSDTGGAGGSGAGTGGASSVSSGASNPSTTTSGTGTPTTTTSTGNPSTTTTSGTGDPSATSTTSTGDPSTTTASTGAGTPSGACPPSATFCSDFEAAGLPAGATYRPSYQAADALNNMEIDASTFHAGAHSLHVKPGGGGYDWRMLSVPAPGPKFWARLYVRSSVEIGQAEHNAFFQAMTGDGDPNAGDNVEVAEQFCQILLNLHDALVLQEGATSMCGSGTKLPANTWHCMEAYFDGTKGDVQVYANGTKIIDKTGWDKLDFKTFSFGYLGFHGPARSMWYDDVAVAPERIGCAP